MASSAAPLPREPITDEPQISSRRGVARHRALLPATVNKTPVVLRLLPRVGIVHEADEYTEAVAGMRVGAIRTGRGRGPNRVLGVSGEQLTVTSCEIGFPMLTHAHIPEDRIVITFIVGVDTESRWCSIPLRPGSVMVYGPGVDHAAVNRPGLRFTFVQTKLEVLLEFADRAQVNLDLPALGSVRQVAPTPTTGAIGDALAGFSDAGSLGQPLELATEDVLSALTRVLSAERPRRELSSGSGLNSRSIVHDCVDFAATVERLPSVRELCNAANVSERRLRTAFTDEFDQPPSRFFRAWALSVARRRLRQANPHELTVTQVAMELGFDHLGRFAGYYRGVYAEPPSATLRGPDRRPVMPTPLLPRPWCGE